MYYIYMYNKKIISEYPQLDRIMVTGLSVSPGFETCQMLSTG